MTEALDKLIDEYGSLKHIQGQYDNDGEPTPHETIKQIDETRERIIQELMGVQRQYVFALDKLSEAESRYMKAEKAGTWMADLIRLQRQHGGGLPSQDVDEFLSAFPNLG